MSVSNQPPAPCTDYSDLCKPKPADSFSGKHPCTQPQKNWSQSEWEWHRAEEQLGSNLKVESSSAASAPAKDGLIKHVALTDEDKLGFFGTTAGGIEQKNMAGEAQSKEFFGNWASSSANLTVSDQNIEKMNPVRNEWSQAAVGKQVSAVDNRTGKKEVEKNITEERTDKNGELTVYPLDAEMTHPSTVFGNLAQNIKKDEFSVWNPNFMPDNMDLSCKQMADFKGGEKSTLNEMDIQSKNVPAYTLTIQKSETPTMVDYEQDLSDINPLNESLELNEDVRIDLVNDGTANRATQQRKMMRRAMSECSHLSVPSSFGITEKYPEPLLTESPGNSVDHSENSPSTQLAATSSRKCPISQIKRSMTVAEEQIPAYSFGNDQTAADLQFDQLADEGHGKERNKELDITPGTKDGVTAPFYHGKLEKIPEFSSSKIPEEMLHSKKEQTSLCTNLQKKTSVGSDQVLSLGGETIEVNNAKTFPLYQLQENPHDPMLINSAFTGTICNASETSQKIEMTHYKPEQAAQTPQELAQTSIQQETGCMKIDASFSEQQQPLVSSVPHGFAESSKAEKGKNAELSETTGSKDKEPTPNSIMATYHKLDYIQAKPEEATTEDVNKKETAAVSKEHPQTPDAKGKPGTLTTKISPTKTKPQPSASLKRPAAAAPSPNKKLNTSTMTAATTSKRLPSSLARSSSATNKDVKPKATEAKSPTKPPSSRPPSAGVTKTPSNTTVKSSTTSLQKVATTAGSTPRNTTLSTPRRPTSIKTEPKSTEIRKSLSAKSPLGETGRSKTTSTTSIKSTGTTPSTPSTPLGVSSPGTPSSNTPRAPRTLALKTTAASEAKRVAPISRTPSKPTVAAGPKQLRPTSAPAPDLKNVKSKIGSTDNIKHQPGGGKAKSVEKKPEPVRLNRKVEPSTVIRVAKTTTTKDSQKQTNGKVQIVNKKVDYSHVQSKCGSKDNIKHVPGGGNVQIPKAKVDVSRASSKCGSKTNLKHKAGGGDVKIETSKTNFKNKAESKVGSLDNVNHTPGGGNVKNEGEEESESATISQTPENGELTGQAESGTQQNGVGVDPTAGSDETHSQELQIQETY